MATEKNKKAHSSQEDGIPAARPTLAFLTVAMEDHFSLAMWTAIVEAAHERNANVISIAGGNLNDAAEYSSLKNSIYRAANEDLIDGIIIYGSRLGTYVSEKTFRDFCNRFASKPSVSIGQHVEGIPAVLSDNYIGMHLLVRHLIDDHGYQRIAFVRGPEGQIEAETRFKAYKNALIESGIDIDPNLISEPGIWEAISGEEAVRLFVDERDLPLDAIVCANDTMALAAMWALKNRGLIIPDDVAVVGFDSQVIAKAATPPLSTVRQQLKEQCRYAVDIVLTQLEGGDVPDRIEIPTKLCIRQSCGCASSAVGRAITKTSLKSSNKKKSSINRDDTLSEIAQIVDTTIEGLEAYRSSEINEWQRVISSLRHFTRSQYTDESATERIEELSNQARVLIGEKVQQIETHQSLIYDQQYANLRDMTRAISTALELDDLLETLHHNLLRFGIRSCYLSLYEETVPTAEDESRIDSRPLKMILAFDDKGRLPFESEEPVISTNILPRRRIAAMSGNWSFVVKELERADEPLGTVLFEVYPPDGRACDMLQEQISSSLTYGLLLQERQQEHEVLQQAYTEAEQQAREKEIELEFEIVDREQAQQALMREQHLLRILMENSPDAIYFKDKESRFIKVNTAFARLHDKDSPDELLGLSDFDLFTEEHASEAFEDEMRVLKTGEPIVGKEEKETWPDGHETWVSTTKLPMRDEKGNVTGTFGISRDITESKRVEQELRRHAAHLEAINTIISSTSTAVDFQDLLKISLDLSLYAVEMNMGIIWLPPHTVSRKLLPPENEFPHYDFNPESNGLPEILVVDDWQKVTQEDPRIDFYETFLKTHGIRASITVPIKAEEGNRLGGLCIASPQPFKWTTEETRLLEAVGYQIGIAAERLRLVDQIREQMQQVQQITDTVPDGVLLLDSNHCVILANPAGTRDLQALAKASIGDEISHLGGCSISDILQADTDVPWHEVLTNNRIFEVVARPIDAYRSTENWIIVIRDVTQEREIQRQVQQQERLAAVGQLAGGIAHDFNNLLTTIMLYAQMPLRKQQLPDDLKKPLETILSESRKAASLVQQILDFSRHAPIERHPIDLGPFVKEAVRVLQRTIPENISLYIEIDPDEYLVEADPTRIQQVLMNLVVNARDAMTEGGVLRVGVSRSQVWGIVKQHEGFIKVDSTVGEGTEFLVYLPIHQSAEKVESLPPEDVSFPKGTGERILLVEDSQHVRDVSEELLLDLGYQVVTAKNGREALDLFKHNGNFDLVFTDVVMPEVGGVELLHSLRDMGSTVKTIAVTGHMLAKDLQELRKNGVSGIIFKPANTKWKSQLYALSPKCRRASNKCISRRSNSRHQRIPVTSMARHYRGLAQP
ncbi:MAG: substrate-binding domain-containing protein [Anaerolineales bacterium]